MSVDCAVSCNWDDIADYPEGADSVTDPDNNNVGATVVYHCTNDREVYSICLADGNWSEYIGSCSDDEGQTTEASAAPPPARECTGPTKNEAVGISVTKIRTTTAEECKDACMDDEECLFYNWKKKKCSLSYESLKTKKKTFSGSCI